MVCLDMGTRTKPGACTEVWRIRRDHERRFLQGHPWVYSNELTNSEGGKLDSNLDPGSLVELHDAGGKFLGLGFGNPKSLITFRVLLKSGSRPKELALKEILRDIVHSAWNLRQKLGLIRQGTKQAVSSRVLFGEADRIPGLIVDRYVGQRGEALVIQPQSAGAEKSIQEIISIYLDLRPEATLIVNRKSSMRKLEGLDVGAVEVVHPKGVKSDFTQFDAWVGDPDRPHVLTCDLLGGQKTGLFLDQSQNVQALLGFLEKDKGLPSNGLKLVDLCSYVGQWSTALAGTGKFSNVTCVDASDSALSYAKKNVERISPSVQIRTLKGDVTESSTWVNLESDLPQFDVVICDPPAFIKGRKSIPQGKKAYLALFERALRTAKRGAYFVACSCSGLLSEDEFSELLSRAEAKAEKSVHWVYRGGQAPDHPVLAPFSEGKYLKTWIGVVG